MERRSSMAGSTFGSILKISTWGESHGKAVGAVIDGCPAGLSLCEDDIQKYLDRRKPGQNRYTTARAESDTAEAAAPPDAKRRDGWRPAPSPRSCSESWASRYRLTSAPSAPYRSTVPGWISPLLSKALCECRIRKHRKKRLHISKHVSARRTPAAARWNVS